MVEGREELSDIKGKNTHIVLSEPTCPDKMSEIYFHICCESLANTPKLMRVEKTVG